MNVTVAGVTLKNADVEKAIAGKAFVYFDDIAFNDRQTLSDKDIPVLYDPMRQKRYIFIDLTSLQYEDRNGTKCECGAWSVNSDRHSYFCAIEKERLNARG